MVTAIRVVTFMATACLAAATASAEATAPETRAQMIKFIGELQAHPYAPDSKTKSNTVMAWLTDAPDVTVTVCAGLLDFDRLQSEDGSRVISQELFEEARFMLEHPDKAGDSKAVHLAGVEGALRTYAAMKAAKPGLSLAPMERLIKLKADGKLPETIAKAIGKCEASLPGGTN